MRLGSKKMTGSGSSIAAISRPLASYGFEGMTTFRPAMWVNRLSGRLAVRLAAEDAAAVGRADDHRHRPFAAGAIAHLGDFADDLVVARVDVVGELDLDHAA